MHFILLLLTITANHSYASTSTPILSSSEASVAKSNSSSFALSLRSTTIPNSRREFSIRLPVTQRTTQTSRFSRRLSLVNSSSTIHYSNLDITNPVTAINGTYYFNGTVIKAATASGLNAIFGSGSIAGSSTTGSTTASEGNSGSTTISTASSLRSGSSSVQQTLLRYAQFSAGAYESSCSSPVGSTLVQTIISGTASSGTQTAASGFIARDDSNKELIVAFRGDPTLQLFNSETLLGKSSNLVDVTSAISYPFGAPTGSSVNAELLNAYQLYAGSLSTVLRAQLASHSDYGITFTGHGTGGSLASIAAVHHITLFGDKVPMQVITYGAPRLGNAKWAAYTESLFLTNNVARYLRVTRPNDDVPQVLSTSLGYQHSATELFLQDDSTPTMNIVQCTGSEDVTCNDSQLSVQSTTNGNAGSLANAGAGSEPSLQASSSAPSSALSPAANSAGFSSYPTQSSVTQGNLDTSVVASADVAPLSSTTSGTTTAIAASNDNNVPCSICKGTECIICTQDGVKVPNSVSGASLQGVNVESSSQTGYPGALVSSDTPTNTYARQSSILDTSLSSIPQTVIFPVIYSLATNSSGSLNSSGFITPTLTTKKNSSSTVKTSAVQVNNITDLSSVHKNSQYTVSQPPSIGSSLGTTNLLTVTKAMIPSINAAHLTYLGINMVTGGERFCTADTSVLPSNTIVSTSSTIPAADSGVKTQKVVSAGILGSSSAFSLVCAIMISLLLS